MKNFSLSILDQDGGSREFSLLSENRDALQQVIQTEGWIVLQIRENRFRKMRLHGDELIFFCQHIQLMLDAGLTVHDAISALADESESPHLALLCRGVAERIDKGNTLSQSLEFCSIDSFCLAMIKTGEQTGLLSKLLDRAAKHLQWREDLRRKIYSALSYPILMVVVLCMLVPALFVYLVPQLMNFLDGIDTSLPWYTEALINTADFSQAYGLNIILSFSLLIGCAMLVWLSALSFRQWVDQCFLKLPLLGPLSTQLHTAQLSEQLGIMYSAGVPISDALPLVSRSLSNRFLQNSLVNVCYQLNEGKTLHQAMSLQRFPSMLLRLVLVGEVSGSLDRTLSQAAIFYSRQAHRRADKMAAVVGPLVLFLVGMVLVWLVAALILPLYDGLFSMGTGL